MGVVGTHTNAIKVAVRIPVGPFFCFHHLRRLVVKFKVCILRERTLIQDSMLLLDRSAQWCVPKDANIKLRQNSFMIWSEGWLYLLMLLNFIHNQTNYLERMGFN